MNINERTINFYKTANMVKRKAEGQYMTPSDIVTNALSQLSINKDKAVLEPSFGTGQFLDALIKNNYTNITAVEKDTELYNLSKSSYNNLINQDYLTTVFDKKFGLIIGNPPYFEMKCSKEQKLLFKDIIGGRPNIYSLFIKKSIDELDTNGVLCYVIPTSLLSSKYFEKTRDYIIKYCNIERIEKLNTDDFDGAQQKTMIFQIKKRKSGNNNKKFVVKLGSGIIFTPDSDTINKLLIDKTFIKAMGCSVKTGNVVWNQFRDKYGDLFTNDSDGNTMLVYPRNLTTGKLVADSNKKKFQYIKPSNHETISGPVIAINRIIGMNSISLNPVLIESGSYYFENHINIITGPLDKLKIILESLKKPETIDFIKMIIGNTQLSKTELETMIPIIIEK